MRVTLIYKSDEVHVHRADCRDIPKARRNAANVEDMTVETRQEVANDWYQDFINEGSMTEAEALNYCVFLPCTRGLS